MIDPLNGALDGYFHFHGLRGALLEDLNRLDDAREALNRAIALANSVAEAHFIRRALDGLTSRPSRRPAGERSGSHQADSVL